MGTFELTHWGWNKKRNDHYLQLNLDAELFSPGRIISQREDVFTVVTAEGIKYAHPAGVLFHRRTTWQRPAVGDWVVLEKIDTTLTDESSRTSLTHSVVDVLPRSSLFLREAPGGRGEAQTVATNVDTVFLVDPVSELNLSRLERMAVAVVSGDATPAIVLSKRDLVPSESIELAVEQAKTIMNGIEVVVTSSAPEFGDTIEKGFLSFLEPAQTYALVGPSGVGKSTLVNILMGKEIQQTGAVRESDQKGRHVTTFRELFPLPNGALLMDTPGIREFAVWSQGDGVEAVFSDIEELQTHCRFSDCSHRTEPGCSVLEAVEAGELSERRLENWRALCEELEANRERQELRAARRERTKLRRKVQRDHKFSRSEVT